MPKHMNRKNLFFIENPEPDPAGGPTDPRHESFKDTTFTQEQLTAYLTREKDQGKRAGMREVAEKFSTAFTAAGFEPDAKIEDILNLAKAQKDTEEANKTELEKQQAEIKAREAETAKQIADSQKATFDVLTETLLADAVNTNVAVSSLGAYGITVTSTPAEIKAAVEKLREEVPSLFKAAEPAAPTQRRDTSAQRTNQQAGVTTARDRAKEIAIQRGWSKADAA